jgi:hypothetical protein
MNAVEKMIEHWTKVCEQSDGIVTLPTSDLRTLLSLARTTDKRFTHGSKQRS